MLVADTYTDFYVSPSPLLLIWTVFVPAALVCAIVCGLKGRWIALLLGFLMLGIPWIVGAFLAPQAGSVWARRLARRDAT